nr:ABC transporter substrate-binding protein [Bacillota bacterium]
MRDKRGFKFGSATLALVIAAALLLAACGGSGGTSGGGAGPAEPPATGGEESGAPSQESGPFTLRIGLNAFPPQLDPHLSSAAVDRHVYQSLYDKLVDLDENLNIVPALAERWDISDDGKVYTLYLRQGVKFHDGTPFNAEAVKFNFDRMLDESLGSPRRSEIALVQDVTVVDEYTVQITLANPFSPFLSILADRAGMMVSPTAVQEKGERFSQEPVGTGPFKFVSMVQGDEIVLERNPDYWAAGPFAERVIYKALPDENVKVAQIQAGELHIIDQPVPAPQLPALMSDPNLRVSLNPGLEWQSMWLNVTAPPLDNVWVRRAIAAAIDRETLVKVVFGDAAVPGNTPFPPGYPAHDETLGIPARDVELARQYLAQSGLDSVSFTIKIQPNPTYQRSAEVIQDMLGDVGIDVQIEQVEFGTLLEQTAPNSLNYQAALLGWSGRPDPDQNIYMFLHSTGNQNRSGYKNPEVDRLLDEARVIHDMEQRKELYRQVMDIVLDEVPLVYLYHPTNIRIMRSNLEGFVHVPDGMIRTLELRLAQ